jgi:hypothetical protein
MRSDAAASSAAGSPNSPPPKPLENECTPRSAAAAAEVEEPARGADCTVTSDGDPETAAALGVTSPDRELREVWLIRYASIGPLSDCKSTQRQAKSSQ